MTETKNKNGKSGVYQNSDFGASGVCHKTPDQVGDDSLTVGSGCSKIPAFAGMTKNIRSAGMIDGVKRTGMTGRNKTHRNDVLSHTRGERGRSMVEMLGVLAVMGVLSIGGVAGYRYAIDKMNANDIINEVKKRAVTASQQRILGQNISLTEYGDNGRIKGLYDVAVTNDYTGDKGFFALTVSNVPQRVCDDILKQDWAMPVEMAVGGVVVDDDTTCAEGENEMLFAFANTLDNSHLPGEGGEDDGDESEVQACAEGEYRLSTGECVTDSHPECGDGEFYNEYTHSCTACPTEGNPVANSSSFLEDTCEKCTGAQIGGYYTNYCVYCPDGEACGDQCCGEGQMCQRSGSYPHTYTCVSTLGDGKCWTNDDCGDNQYCKKGLDCGVTIGTCTDISSTQVEINEKTYTMSYHAAENFCDALGKKLAPVTDGCTAEELAAVKANSYSGSCSGWAHTTGKAYWTATKISGCSSYYVKSSSLGAVESFVWGSDYFCALCR